jgi:PTH1 family peptidyl-tRNA hydrolase
VILLVGLGNPGPRYAETRHNIGFMLVDRVATRLGSPVFRDKFQGSFATGSLGGESIGLLKPMTYMNESGRSVQAAMQLYKLQHDAIYVAHDELDLAFGDVRLKVGGGDAGHRGVRSIAGAIGPGFVRLRLGVGRPPPDFRGDPADFVLQGFSLAERPSIDSIVDRAADALALVATRGIQVAMNATNQRQNR